MLYTTVMSKETYGSLAVISSAAIVSLFPIVVSKGVQVFPPLTFAGLSLLITFVTTFLYSAVSGVLPELKKTAAYYPMVINAICAIIVPYSLFFIGAQFTSSINTAALLLSEIIFTVLLTPWFGETTSAQKIFGAGGVFVGAWLLTWHGQDSWQFGDLLIILSTVTFPFGNFYAKRALRLVHPGILLTVRAGVGCVILLLLAISLEHWFEIATVRTYWWYIVLNGAIILGIGKIIWQIGFQRLDIAKAVILLKIEPLISILILVFLLHEPISRLQLLGIGIMLIGVVATWKRRSIDPTLTRYGNTV